MHIYCLAHPQLRYRMFLLTIGISFFFSGSARAMPTGYASLNGGTTGGAAGSVVVATTNTQFQNFATQSVPLTIMVDGLLDIGGVDVESNKTIFGVGSNSGLIGSLQISNESNIIIQNLSLSNPDDDGEGDAITLRDSTNVWIDHNNIFDSPDGLVDIVSESDFVTVSWNKLFYTSDYATNINTNHRFAMLIGNSDGATEDADNLRVTIHHNHWGDFVRERMPRVRYGDVHFFNNYVNSPGNNYVVRSALEAEVLAENNYIENADDPFEKQQTGLIEASGNLLINTTGDDDGSDSVFTPPYVYSLDAAAGIKSTVLAGAGVGLLSGDFNGDGTVDGLDFLEWQTNPSVGDLADWEASYGNPLTPNVTNVPEPATVVLMLVGFCLANKRNR